MNQKDLVKCTQVQIDSVTFLTQWWIIAWTKTWWVWDSMRDGIGKNSPKIRKIIHLSKVGKLNHPIWRVLLSDPWIYSIGSRFLNHSCQQYIMKSEGKENSSFDLLWDVQAHINMSCFMLFKSQAACDMCDSILPRIVPFYIHHCWFLLWRIQKKTHPQLSLILPFCSGIANCTQEWIYWCVYHCLITITNPLSLSLEFLSACPIYCNLPWVKVNPPFLTNPVLRFPLE